MSGPLHGLKGIRVVDLSDDLPGAYCTKLLSDAGAEVIKVEQPGGHSLRRWSSSLSAGADGEADSGLFRYLAASHRSIVVEPEALAIMDGLAPLCRASDIT